MGYTIVVGVEGDPDRRAALFWAADRAARDGAELVLVYVIEQAWSDGLDEPDRLLVLEAEALLAAEREIAQRHAEERARARQTQPSSGSVTAVHPRPIKVATRYAYGHPGTELAAESQDADLLVVGTRSALEQGHDFTGSLAIRVAATAQCPVAVIPHGWADDGSGVVVGVDGELPSEEGVAFAVDEAAAWNEPLTVVCAGYTANPLLAGLVPESTLGDRRQRIVGEAAAEARELHPEVEVRSRVVEAPTSQGLVDAAEGSRLLVVGTHNRHGVKRLMLGSTSHDVLLNVRTPVVVVRNYPSGTSFRERTT
ncbi:universal stress protein [Leifsonia sp. 2MCAF36]|uniref:universal stress protein n=1 Tax=Leifsonia sp. 2MCAF36 TaxID=3232988 RepID=UPI003F9AEF8E